MEFEQRQLIVRQVFKTMAVDYFEHDDNFIADDIVIISLYDDHVVTVRFFSEIDICKASDFVLRFGRMMDLFDIDVLFKP